MEYGLVVDTTHILKIQNELAQRTCIALLSWRESLVDRKGHAGFGPVDEG
jgi:hypothetical protein